MKAIRVHESGGPEVLQLDDIADPIAGPGEAVVEVKAVGVNPVDTYVRAGAYANLPEMPYIPGGDCAGVVTSLGEGVSALEVGQRVYTGGVVGGQMTGCYAAQVVRPADQLFPLPDTASYGQGAALGVPYGTAHYGLFHRGQAKAGESLLVHGASGSVGSAAVQFARALGMTVIGTAGTEKGKALVREQGADHVLDHTDDGYVEAVGELTGGAGPDIILEMLANVNLAKDLAMVARYGRIIVIGNRGPIEINPRDAMMKDADIRGLALWNASDAELATIHQAIIDGLSDGSLNPVINREIPLADAPAAHIAVLEPGAYGKIVLIP